MRFASKRRIIINIILLVSMYFFLPLSKVYADKNDPLETAYAIAVEGEYVYIAGQASRLAENLPAGSLDLSGKMEDIWLVKLNKDGTPVFQALIGGSQSDSAYGITVHQGIVYLVGETWSSDFPAAPGSAGENDAIILAIAADGSGILWARRLGGSDQDSGRAITYNGNSIYFSGITWSKDFISGQAKGDADGFVGRIETDGSLTWLQVFGGNLLDAPFDIAVTADQVWITGQTFSFNYGGSPIGGGDIFLTRFSTNGSPEYSGLFGGREEDLAFSLSLIERGGVYITGGTQSTDLPNARSQYVDSFDSFVMKVNAENEIEFSTYIGGTGHDYGYDIKTLPNGDAILSGSTYSTIFPVGYDQELTTSGGQDGYIALVDSDGFFKNLNLMGGEGSDRAVAIDLTAEGIWVTGRFSSEALKYVKYLDKDLLPFEPLPTNPPSIPTATMASTATYQPTETPSLKTTEMVQESGEESQRGLELSTQQPSELVVTLTQTHAEIQNFTQIAFDPQISSTEVESKNQIKETTENPNENDTNTGMIIVIGAILLSAVSVIFWWMKKRILK